MAEPRSDAHEMSVPDLLRSAARLMERALIRLDTEEAPCPTCKMRLFHDRIEARIYGQFSDLPERLKTAAGVLQGHATSPSEGYAVAKAKHRLVTTERPS